MLARVREVGADQACAELEAEERAARGSQE
jgi:hypothetical protein